MLASWSRIGIGVAVIAAAAIAGAGCDAAELVVGASHGPARRGSDRDPDTLVIGRPADALALDPARTTDSESIEVVGQIYDQLIQYRPGTTTIEPGLATSWEVDDHGRAWTFHLRQGVRFHDGTPMDADAVVFSLERQRDPAHPYHRDDFQYWHSQFRNIERVEKLDAATVRITIERPYAPFEANLAMFAVSIVSPTAVATWGDDFADHPVGTGPFRFEAWDKGARLTLVRNDDYWGGRAELARLVFEVIADPRQRLIALESGAVDLVASILPEELQFVDLHPGLALHETATNSVSYLAMNTTHPPFDDLRVRQAVNMAINKEPIVKLAYQGLAIPADGPLPPTQWGYHKIREPWPYDPGRARTLLAAAAADGKFDAARVHRLYVPTTPRPYLPNPERVARVLQANLADVGVRTELVMRPFAEHLRATQQGEHDLCVLGWVGDNGDPDNFLFTLFDRDNTEPGMARNVAFYRDPEVHGLLVLAQESDDRVDRERLYARVQERLVADAPWVPLAHAQTAIAARDDVGGIILNPTGHVAYRSARRLRK